MSREIFRKLLRVLRNLKGFLGADLMRVRVKYLFLSLFISEVEIWQRYDFLIAFGTLFFA